MLILIFIIVQIFILVVLLSFWLRAVHDKVNELVENVNEINEYLNHNRRR